METRGILSDLYDLDFRGRLPTFINGFLSHRLFQVRAGSTLSNTYEQEMVVPQGSILSPVLFSLKINNIVKSVLKGSKRHCSSTIPPTCTETYATVCKQRAALGL